jgi:hypothetical protein
LAEVNKDSIFLEAHDPASELDLKLAELQTRWLLLYVISSDDKIRKRNPLITRVGATLELSYSRSDDRIIATAHMTNTDGFLSLSEKERKRLVINLLENIWSSLLTDVNEKSTPLKKDHIILRVKLRGLVKNDKNEDIFLLLPFGSALAGGQAGYKDGQFVYSESYFLKLTISEGRAKSGDGTKFVIEKEP